MFLKLLIRYVVNHLCSGPIVALELLGDNAIARWKEVIGPEDSDEARLEAPSSIRACYGKDKIHNAVHGSENEVAAAKVCITVSIGYINTVISFSFSGTAIFLSWSKKQRKGTT